VIESSQARFLLDSDVVIWMLRGHAPTRDLLNQLARGGLACSALTVYEVWVGARDGERDRTRRVLNALRTAPATAEMCYAAADYVQTFRREGITLGDMDSIIAATAKVGGYTLLTYNRRHFPMDDIALYDPMPELG